MLWCTGYSPMAHQYTLAQGEPYALKMCAPRELPLVVLRPRGA